MTTQQHLQWYIVSFDNAKGLTTRLHRVKELETIKKIYDAMSEPYTVKAATFADIEELLGISQGEPNNEKLAIDTALFVKGKKGDVMICVLD